jgi:hypothetical protein
MLILIFNPATDREERIPFTVSEANLEDALDYGRAERDMPFDEQIDATAYHMVLDLNVCADPERISSEPWVIVRDNRVIGRNHLIAEIDDEDLEP